VLLALAWWQRGRITRRDLLRVAPYVLVGAVMAGVEVWGQHLVTGEAVRSDGLLSRAAVAGCAVWFYLGKLIWPLDLCFFYPRWTIDDRSVLSYLPGIALVALLALAWWRRRTWGRPVVMLVVCYAALLLPVLGFVNIYAMRFSLAADHWQYAASVVPCAIFAGASATVARRARFHPRTNFLLSLWVVLTLAGLTWRQCRMYADADTLYQTTISRNPACWLAHNNLGMDLLSRGQFDEAVSHFKTALEIKPDFEEAHYNLANALAGRGDVDEAIAHYRKALEIEPDYAIAHNNLGAILFARGRVDEAVAHYTKALAAMPNNAEAHNNVGIVLAGRGYLDEAIGHYQKALEINPNFAAAEYDLALALAAAGRLDEAIARYQRALEIKPDYVGARLNLAAARRKRETILTAINERREAMRSRPNDVALFNDTAWTLASNPNESIRNGAEAVKMAERALPLGGDRDPAVLDTLAAAYAEAGRFSEAINAAKKAIALARGRQNDKLAGKIAARLALYEGGHPYRDSR
jgi:tetratricopeptide (TPR) repeat protein